jgi:hypothetical protein
VLSSLRNDRGFPRLVAIATARRCRRTPSLLVRNRDDDFIGS